MCVQDSYIKKFNNFFIINYHSYRKRWGFRSGFVCGGFGFFLFFSPTL